MSLAGFLVRDHCQKCKLMWNVATTAGVFKLLISLACVITLIAQFWSGCFRAFAHLVLSLYIFPFADPISVENCLRWALMTGLRRFAIYSGGIFSEGWLDSWKVPAMPRHQPSISTRQRLTDKKDKFFFIHLASNNLSPIWRYPKNWSLFTGKKKFVQWIALSISRTTEAWVWFPRLPVSSKRNVLYERSSDKFPEERLVTGLKHSDVLKKNVYYHLILLLI